MMVVVSNDSTQYAVNAALAADVHAADVETM